MRKFSVTIRGDKWKVRLISHKEFRKTWPKTEAVTLYKHDTGFRELWFSDKHITRGHVVHEVLHAYFSYRDFTRMSYGQIEEDICEYLDDRYWQVLKVSRNIYSKLR